MSTGGRVLYLGAWFLLGCIASSFLSWLGSMHPALLRVMFVVYFAVAVGIGLAVVCDDAVRPFLKMSENDYYGSLIAITAALVLGGALAWLTR